MKIVEYNFLDFLEIRQWVNREIGKDFQIIVSDESGYCQGESRFFVWRIMAWPIDDELEECWPREIAEGKLSIRHVLWQMVNKHELEAGDYNLYYQW